MSIPGWTAQTPWKQRGPNGLVIGPLTGQISPAADGVAVGPAADCACACAARIAAPS